MIIGGVPPRRAFWLSRDDPLAVSGQPWLYVALFDLARLTRVIDDDLENRRFEGEFGLQVHTEAPIRIEYRNIWLRTFTR